MTCRALLARGITGTLVMDSPCRSAPRMKVDIEQGAKMAVIDKAEEGPRIGRYRPHPGSIGEDEAE
jgi:hypothetical protein